MQTRTNYRIWAVCWLVAGVLMFALPLAAQIHVGEAASLDLTGNVSTGYSGAFSDRGDSSNGLTMGGNANLNGSYFDPRFLSFSLQPYYNRSQANSSYQSIENSSGVMGNVNFFSGSRTPGSITYDKTYGSTGQFGIPGTAGLVTHGNSQGLGIGWSALYPGLPTLSANYTRGSGTSSVYGVDSASETSNSNTMLRSNYGIAGFRLDGTFSRGTNSSDSSLLLTDVVQRQQSHSSSNDYQISASHRFPLRGSFSAQYGHLNYNSEYGTNAQKSGGSGNTAGSSLSILPFQKLSVSAQADYSDNLVAGLEHEIIASNGQLALIKSSTSSGYRFGGQAFYTPISILGLGAHVQHQVQTVLGQSYALTTFGWNANTNYSRSRPFLRAFTFNGGMSDSASEQGNSSLGFFGSVSFHQKVLHWDIQSSFGYSQNVQTILAIYTTSSMSYGASAHRRMAHHTFVNLGFSGGHSGISRESGNGNHSEQYFSTLIYSGFNFTGNYSKFSGTSIYTSTGLVTLPGNLPPGFVSPNYLVMTDGSSYSFGVSANLLRRLNINGSYSKSSSMEQTPGKLYQTNGTSMNGTLIYKFRKLNANAGFTRLQQSSTTVANPMSVINSYYFGISRWFNFF